VKDGISKKKISENNENENIENEKRNISESENINNE